MTDSSIMSILRMKLDLISEIVVIEILGDTLQKKGTNKILNYGHHWKYTCLNVKKEKLGEKK